MSKEMGKFEKDGATLFDKPSALRTLLGVSTFVNEYSKTRIELDHYNENLFVMMGCSQRSQEQVMLNPVPNNQLEISGMQNFLDWLVPYNMKFNISSLSIP